MSSLPEGWREATIGDVTMVNPRRPSSLRSLPDDHDVTFVPMPAVDEHSGTIATPTVRPFKKVKKGFTYFAENDVIFAKITPCMQNGKSAIARGLANGLGMGSTEFHVLRCDSEQVLPEWIWYFVRNPVFRTEATYHFRGAVGQQRVPADFVAQHPIPVPPLDEQRRIVGRIREMMERVDEIRVLRRANTVTAPALLPTLLREAFSELEHGPTKIPLGDVAINTRYGTSEKCSATNSGTPVLRIPNVAGRRCNFDDLKYLPRKVEAGDPLILKPGDLLVVRTNGSPDLVGRCAVVPDLGGEFGYASYLIRFRFDLERVRPQFVSYYLSSAFGRQQIAERRRTSAGQYNINSTNLKTIEVPVPPLEAQDSMLERMRRIDHAVRDVDLRTQEQGSRQESVVQAILRKAFAGEL